MKPLLRPLASLVLGLLVLAGCSSAELAVHIAKKAGPESAETAAAAETRPLPPAARQNYKLGLPYVIRGDWYYPSYDPFYNRTGTASWYGPTFHGRPTANGERFDMNEVSAAHPTLPLPSRVRVTNLENGRQLVVRVNDRGPFIGERLIDLSRRAAQLLGFYNQGLARVRVQYLGLDRIQPDAPPQPTDRPVLLAARGTPPVAFKPPRRASTVAAAALPPVKPVRTARARPRQVQGAAAGAASRAFLIEAAVVEGREAAERLSARVRPFGAVAVAPERRGSRLVYAVRIGPIVSGAEADSILAQLIRAGLTDSRIVAAGYR